MKKMQMLIGLVALALPLAQPGFPASPRLTSRVCSKLFRFMDSCNPSSFAGDMEYCSVFDDDGCSLGYAFAVPVTVGPGRKSDLFVGVKTDGRVSRVLFEQAGFADEEFLRQCAGKTLKDAFTLARTPEDLLCLPAKMRPMAGNADLSQAIASLVQTVLKKCAQLEK